MSNERRRTSRVRSLKAARIDYSPNWPYIDCMVRNLTAKGACVEVPGEFNAPLSFELIFMQDQARQRCRQIWRRENRIGVTFDWSADI